MIAPVSTPRRTVVLIGRESVGKTQLAGALAQRTTAAENFRGSTVSVDCYRSGDWDFVDTPGILRSSDTQTTIMALRELDSHDTVILVVQATCIDDDLQEMLPLVAGKAGIVVITFWDRVHSHQGAVDAVARLERELRVPVVPINAVRPSAGHLEIVRASLERTSEFCCTQPRTRVGWNIEPQPGVLERPFLGPIIAGLILTLPALTAVCGANRFAEWLHPFVQKSIDPLARYVSEHAPRWLATILIGQHNDFAYGLLSMGPFLFVWALPTVVMFAAIGAIYKTTGLIDRLEVALHPMVRALGLSGRDLIRIMMGFGCNVPAVISTRACSSCSRSSAVAAISFGAACSYQLPATLAVLSVAAASSGTHPAWLAFGFLGYLVVTTAIYLRATCPRLARSRANPLLHYRRQFLQRPTPRALWVEVRATIHQFVTQALPVFLSICVVASVAVQTGLMETTSALLRPAMAILNLPPEAAVAMVMGSIRKDGIFLLISGDRLVADMTAGQALTAVYLAGVLLPCLVTALQIGRELGWPRALKIVTRQATFAVGFTYLLSVSTRLLGV